MLRRVYIETTIPSYYFDERTAIQADILRTREWWDTERQFYDCVTSLISQDELLRGRRDLRFRRAALLDGLQFLAVSVAALQLAAIYRVHKLMPQSPPADSLHVALASVHSAHVLLTWNCRHLANENKAQQLARINLSHGYSVPRILTPHQLRMTENQDEP